MAIRQKLKAKFGLSKSSSSSDTSSVVCPEGYYMGRKDIEYYKPSEIPKSKYRGKVDPEHQEHLDSYSFGDAFQAAQRRASAALSGTFSPGGTKSLSAAPSAAVSRRASWMSRNGSDFSTAATSHMSSDFAGVERKGREGDKISENSIDDTDVGNTGLSRRCSIKDMSTLDAQLNAALPIIRLERQATQPAVIQKTISNDTPFTVEQLEHAITRATMYRQSISREPVAVA